MAPPRLLKYVGVSLAVHVVAIVVVALLVLVGRIASRTDTDPTPETAEEEAAKPIETEASVPLPEGPVDMPERPSDVELFGKGR